MHRTVASILFACGILCLFLLDRGRKPRVSKALWIPTVWLFFISTRPLSAWLGMPPSDAGTASLYVDGSPIDRTFFMVLEAVALFVVVGRWRRVGPLLRKNWPIAVYFFYAALSISWSEFPLVTFKHWIKGMGDVMIVLIVLTEPSFSEAIQRLITRLAFVLLPLSVLFIKYYPELGRVLDNSWGLEAVGVCRQKNSLGELCLILGIGLVWRFRSAWDDRGDPNRKRRLLALGAVLAMVVRLLWMCRSMTSIAAFSMGTVIILLSTRRAFRRSPALMHLLVAGMIAFTLYAVFFQSSGAVLHALGKSTSLTGRTETWPIILAIPDNRLVGTGYESFWMGPRILKLWADFPKFHIEEAHNGYIEMLINLGWIGVGLLGLMIATGYRNLARLYRRNPEAGGVRIAWFLATILTGLTEAAFRMMSLPWIFFLLATAAVSVEAARKPGRQRRLRRELPRPAEEPEAVREEALVGYRLGSIFASPSARSMQAGMQSSPSRRAAPAGPST
jgi:hypothetical protein